MIRDLILGKTRFKDFLFGTSERRAREMDFAAEVALAERMNPSQPVMRRRYGGEAIRLDDFPGPVKLIP